MKRILIFFILCLQSIACSKKQTELAQILRLENRRVACDSLLHFLGNPEPVIRARAVEALGKLQDDRCLSAVQERLSDENEDVRLQAAFALGQLGETSVEEALVKKLAAEPSREVRRRLIEALGKIGTEQSAYFLAQMFEVEDSKLRAEAALSAARWALRGITDSTLTRALPTLLDDDDPEVRWKACYALMRIGENLDLPRLKQALEDEDPRVRMYAVQALGNLKEVSVLEVIGTILRTDPDWRVRVKAANALANYSLNAVANYLYLSNQKGHVRVAIIQAIGRSALNEPNGFQPNSREHNLAKHHLEQGLVFPQTNGDDQDEEAQMWPPWEIGAALISYAQLLHEQALPRIYQFSRHPDPKVRLRAVQALGKTGSSSAGRLLQENYKRASKTIRIAILEALIELEEFSDPQLFLEALNENDPVLVALAAQALSQDTLNNQIYASRIIEAYQRLPKPVELETAKMIIEALGKIGNAQAVPLLTEVLQTPDRTLSTAAAAALQNITGEDYSNQIAHFTRPHEDFTYDEILELEGARAFIKTRKGTIEIELFTEDAPLTVLNFARLAEKGFFDRLTFHRVVPNFVIQGGDPRGDSWGSPGYAIRSEFNKRPFLRGTVGMASAGKDTEGCQFFITHSEQPHLDGRYTVFGQVTSGMQVVDAIREGDVMELVTVRR